MNEEIIEKTEETESQSDACSQCGDELSEKESVYCFLCESKLIEGPVRLIKAEPESDVPKVDNVDLERLDHIIARGYNGIMDHFDERVERDQDKQWWIDDLHEIRDEFLQIHTLFKHLDLKAAETALSLYEEKINEVLMQPDRKGQDV